MVGQQHPIDLGRAVAQHRRRVVGGGTWLFSSQSIGGYVRIGYSVLAVVVVIVLAPGRPNIGSHHLLRWPGYPVRIRHWRLFGQVPVWSGTAEGHAGAQSGSMAGLIHRSIRRGTENSGSDSCARCCRVTPGSRAVGQASSAANAAPSAVSSGTARSTVSGRHPTGRTGHRHRQVGAHPGNGHRDAADAEFLFAVVDRIAVLGRPAQLLGEGVRVGDGVLGVPGHSGALQQIPGPQPAACGP